MQGEDSVTLTGGTISRRATLSKGVAAGALAWTTPVVLSTSANAGTTCTPRCIPPATPTGTISGTWDTNSIDFTISVDGFTCPCAAGGGGTSPAVVSSITGNLTRSTDPDLGDCSQSSNPTLLSGTRTGNQLAFPRTGYRDSVFLGFPIGGTNYCYSGSIVVTVTCQDRSGDTISSTATFPVPQFRISRAVATGNVFASPTTRTLTFGNFSC